MPTSTVASDRAPRAIGTYSQAVVAEGPGLRTLWTAGQIALDPVTMELTGRDVRAQTERVMQNLEAVLAAAGMGFADVVKTTVFLADMADFAAMNEVYATRFAARPPARSTVQAAALPRGARVEIELVAVRDPATAR
jgi:2-iminobutanoate/2-iminopropanoate deaminase